MDKKDIQNLGINTRCQMQLGDHSDQYGACAFPIYQSATFAHHALFDSTGFDYTRVSNPTREQVEATMASLESGTHALGFSTGMAAITLTMEIFQPGDHIIADADLYGGSTRLFNTINTKNGLEFTQTNISQTGIVDFIQPNTKAVFLETPSNPMMNVVDLRAIAADCKAHGLLLIVDNTFLSPYFQRPLELGADIVIHSATKYLEGHNDTLGGFVIVKDDALYEQLYTIYKTTGACLAPFDAFLIQRGIKTLGVRLERAQSNALALAKWLQANPHVTKVLYPGLPEHPAYEIMKSQCDGFGAMLTFDVESAEFAVKVLNNVEVFPFAESLGGTETLLTYPITQTHAEVPKELLAANGITDRTLRLSVGIEDIDDLIHEFERVFAI